MSIRSEPVGVVLFNMGGPEDLDAVEPFLVTLFSDRDIIELPLGAFVQPLFARLIAKARGPAVRRNYALIGGGSPQLRLTRAQAQALEDRLNQRGTNHTRSTGASPPSFRVFVSMRYTRPSAADALTAIAAAGIRRVVTLSLFPHWTAATTGSWQRQFERTLNRPEWRAHDFTISKVDRYADHPLYLDALTDTVRTSFETFPTDRREGVVILFSAHGLPQRFVDRGDPYVGQIEQTRQGVLARLGLPNRQRLGYQSRTGPVTWIGPGTDEWLRELGAEGVRDVLVVPLSFVSEHIETLYEIDILFREVARQAGITGYRRPKALDTHPLFIEALAQMVVRHLGSDAPAADAVAVASLGSGPPAAGEPRCSSGW